MEPTSDDDLAVQALQIFRGHKQDVVLGAIVRLAASAVIGRACTRDSLYGMIDSLLEGSAN